MSERTGHTCAGLKTRRRGTDRVASIGDLAHPSRLEAEVLRVLGPLAELHAHPLVRARLYIAGLRIDGGVHLLAGAAAKRTLRTL